MNNKYIHYLIDLITAVTIALLYLLSPSAKAQTTVPVVIINIDSGAYVDTAIGYSITPFQTNGVRGYHTPPAQYNNWMPSYTIYAGFKPKGIYTAVSLQMTKQFNSADPLSYGLTGVNVYLILSTTQFRWCSNYTLAQNGALYPFDTSINTFSGEGYATLKCTPSNQQHHVRIQFHNVQY